MRKVCQSVGYGSDPLHQSSRIVAEVNDQYAIEEEDPGYTDRHEVDLVDQNFPTFFPTDLVDILPGAQKSLGLLQAADPDHPFLKAVYHRDLEWFWKDSQIEAAWFNDTDGPDLMHVSPSIMSPKTPSQVNHDDLSPFLIYDMEPGSHLKESEFDAKFVTTSSNLESFITDFPESFPPITPTLGHLATLIFRPLLRHSTSLSGALLSLFLSNSSPLNLRRHLELLRSCLLLTSPSFKSRLSAALFSDSGSCDYDHDSARPSLHSLRQRPSKHGRDPNKSWAVGLSPNLTERDTWPPGGSDLSFFLRTVIVDSFEPNFRGGYEGEAQSGQERLFAEAEYRLGFAIRDLPVGAGRDRWLNPLGMWLRYTIVAHFVILMISGILAIE